MRYLNDYQIADFSPLLTSSWLGKHIYIHETLDSTQAEARRLANEGAGHGTVVLAREQMQGRGRLGRSWLSSVDKGVWLTVILRPRLTIEHLPQITLLTGLAIREVLSNLYGINPLIKWPNDIYIEGRKLAGILTEALSNPEGIDCLLVGIGINTDLDQQAYELANKRIALAELVGQPPAKLTLITNLLNKLAEYFDSYEQVGFEPYLESYQDALYGKGARITVDGSLKCRISGINLAGELLVVDDQGSQHAIGAGEIIFME